MEINTEDPKFREGFDDGQHARTCWDTDFQYVAGFVRGYEQHEEANIRRQLGPRAR